jgi:predicted alpha/beta hydrolase family esterase
VTPGLPGSWSGARRFLVLHGWQNRRPPGHWQWQLVEALRAAGEQVLYPQLPEPDRPSLEQWTALLRAELAQLGSGERVVVAHSLSVPLWFHAAPLLEEHERVDRVLLVAPPSPGVLARHPEVAAFATVPHDVAAVARRAGITRLVCSDDDPYCPEVATTLLGDLDTDLVPGGRHLDPDAGYGAWPSALAWCLDPATRLTAR